MASREAAGLSSGAGCANQGQQAGNGAQQGFPTGATRSSDAGKFDYEGHINPEVLTVFAEYMNRHRIQRDGRVRASDNWQQGIPIYCYVKSFVRHGIEFWRMWRGVPVVNVDSGNFFTFRDVLSALLFNVMGIIFEMNKKGAWMLDRTYLPDADRRQLEAVDQAKEQMKRPEEPTRKEAEDQRATSAGYSRQTEREMAAVRAAQELERVTQRISTEHITGQQLRAAGFEEGTYRVIIERE